MIHPSKRRGATLIELLVVVSILGVLLALIVPAVQDVRESARRASCANNLKQIGLGLQQYEQTFGSLPPGRMLTYDPRYAGKNPPCTSRLVDKSMLVMILPYIEQVAIYNAVNQDLTILGRENRTVFPVSVGIFACPSDPARASPTRPAMTSWSRMAWRALVRRSRSSIRATPGSSAPAWSRRFHFLARWRRRRTGSPWGWSTRSARRSGSSRTTRCATSRTRAAGWRSG